MITLTFATCSDYQGHHAVSCFLDSREPGRRWKNGAKKDAQNAEPVLNPLASSTDKGLTVESRIALQVEPVELIPLEGGISGVYEGASYLHSETQLEGLVVRKGLNLRSYEQSSEGDAQTKGDTCPTKSDAESRQGDHARTLAHSQKPKAEWYLIVEIWKKGQVDLDVCVDKLTQSINATFHEYFIETMLHSYRNENLHARTLKSLKVPFQPSASLNLSYSHPTSNHSQLTSIHSAASKTSPEMASTLTSPQFISRTLEPCLNLFSSAMAVSTPSVQR